MTTVLLIIDMQEGAFTPRSASHDAAGLVARLNVLAAETRARGGRAVFVQHDGPPGDDYHPDAPGWPILPDFAMAKGDTIIHKQSCDSFLHTDLDDVLRKAGASELIITGSATDYCVDTTVRSALGRGWKTTVPSDGHTTSTRRPHLKATEIIAHHNAIWADFLSPAGAARICPCSAVFSAR